MLAKNTALYFFGRGIPGVINFISISVFTTHISPYEYGLYAIAFAIITFFNTVFFSWIRLSTVRYYPIAVDNSELPAFYSSVAAGFVISALLSGFMLMGLYIFGLVDFDSTSFFLFIALGILFQGFFEIGLEYFVSCIKPKLYSLSFLIKAVFNFLIGYLLVIRNYGGFGLLLSLNISLLLALILFFRPLIKNLWISISHFNVQFFKSFFFFGLPFTLSFGMVYIFNTLDRFFLDYYLGKDLTGIYSVSFDLSRQTLWIFFTSISLAGFPLALKLIQQRGNSEGLKQMEKNFILLITICTPMAFSLALLAKDFSEVFVGNSFRQGVQELIPLLSVGTLILGIKNFYFDQSFQISKKTLLQIIPVISAAVVSIILNIIFIPLIGVKGAAYSSLISFTVGLLFSIWLSQKTFPLPIPYIKLGKVIIANAIMLIAIFIISSLFRGISSLIISLIIGSIIYFCLIHFLGVLNITTLINQTFKKK